MTVLLLDTITKETATEKKRLRGAESNCNLIHVFIGVRWVSVLMKRIFAMVFRIVVIEAMSKQVVTVQLVR